MDNKKVQVRILGNEYCLVTNETEEHLVESARLVDSLMQEIVQGARVDEKKAAVLAALRIASRALKSEAEAHMVLMQKEAADTETRAVFARKEADAQAIVAKLEALAVEIGQELQQNLVKD